MSHWRGQMPLLCAHHHQPSTPELYLLAGEFWTLEHPCFHGAPLPYCSHCVRKDPLLIPCIAFPEPCLNQCGWGEDSDTITCAGWLSDTAVSTAQLWCLHQSIYF